MTVLLGLGYVVVLVACLRAAYGALDGSVRPLDRPRPTALVLWLVVAVPSVVALAAPPLYDALARRPELIVQGQVWRLLTSVVVQDGGVAGTVFNLVVLALTLPAAVALRGPVGAVTTFVVGTLVFDLFATFVRPEAGGGNSGATFFLATSLLGLVLRRRRTGARTATGVVALVGILLLVAGDIHGVAVLAGLAVGVLLAALPDRRRA